MLDYMPADPIPAWPKRRRGAARALREAVATHALNSDGDEWNKQKARFNSMVFHNGSPLTCLSCGARTDADGALPCGH